MADDLIGTKAAADILGRTVATLNRWAAEKREDTPQPAVELPGKTGARLYRRADVEALAATERARAIAAGACPDCYRPGAHTLHTDGVCPFAEQVAS